MTDCREQSWLFQDLGNRKVEVDFGGGYLSSDGGGLILRELERHSGLLRDFSGCFVDYRDQRYVEHSVQELVSQRIHGLVLGYEDLNDHDHLRLDPIHGLIAAPSMGRCRAPLSAARRVHRQLSCVSCAIWAPREPDISRPGRAPQPVCPVRAPQRAA